MSRRLRLFSETALPFPAFFCICFFRPGYFILPGMARDIREKPVIDHQDVIDLNFIRPSARHVFRRHFRQGLRSHVMEVLAADDVAAEIRGVVENGVRMYPRARPRKMLRIFRSRFPDVRTAVEEISRVKIAEIHLTPLFIARSQEFLVTYRCNGRADILLCGLQEYVEGWVLDPWRPFIADAARERFESLRNDPADGRRAAPDAPCRTFLSSVAAFIANTRRMIRETGHIPDIAGVGNLIVQPSGNVKLVDINNIIRLSPGDAIQVDDKGYPAADKSVEALSILERSLTGKPADDGDDLYRRFLRPERMKKVAALDAAFHDAIRQQRTGCG